MDELCAYAHRPLAFLYRYLRLRAGFHSLIVIAVLAAGGTGIGIWGAFLLLVALIAGDNLLWRLASWMANFAFVAVTGDLRRDLFHHLTGHSPHYFADRMPGMLTSRITATSNAVFMMENMFVWNVLPPCVATVAAIAFVMTVSLPMAACLAVVAAIMVTLMFRVAAAGQPLHHDYARKTAAVDGELVDVITNMPLVRAFCGSARERRRFEATVDREMTARRRSLRYLEKLRVAHAVITVVLTLGLLAWALLLWQRGGITTGEVVLACTLSLSILHATRDLAVALVDVTQHLARLSEALVTLLVPHELRDRPNAAALIKCGVGVSLEKVSFCYPDGRHVFDHLDLRLLPGQRVGLIGHSGAGKSTLLQLLQRFYDPQRGRVLIDNQDIATVTQESLRAAIGVVPQDVSLFQRSVMENIRYGRPHAADEDVCAAAAAARSLDFIATLPDGMDTLVGERGVKLSGGQRQRIAIARAFLKDAPLLLLDEATSSLDSESEATIREALDRLMRGRTVIAIAHRLATVRDFDRIIVLRAGQILQDGPPDQLMRREGIYRWLVQQEIGRLNSCAA